MCETKKTPLKTYMDYMREAREVKCPKCGYVFDGEDLGSELITYWAEAGPVESECPSCQAELMIEESVERTYEVKVKPFESECGDCQRDSCHRVEVADSNWPCLVNVKEREGEPA